MSRNNISEEDSEYQRNEPNSNLPPTMLVLIVISTFGAGVFFGILLYGAFLSSSPSL